MKKLLKITVCTLIWIAIFTSCKKENNKAPFANAGTDQTIALPKDSTRLDGSASTDPDGSIATYKWTKISGPFSANIITANSAQSLVTNLVHGVYRFELRVTDAGGLQSMDTVNITVSSGSVSGGCADTTRPRINARLVPVGTLSEGRSGMSVAAAGNKILFAGSMSSTVDIFDINSQTLTTAGLSVARSEIATAALGNKVFFGGGEISDGTFPTNAVDIYDVSTNSWTTASLTAPGHLIGAAAVGNKVLFAGGDHGFNITSGISRSTTVDIYDVSTNAWSTASLSEPRIGNSAVTIGNKIYFAGGGSRLGTSNTIDVYDNATNLWSTLTLKEKRRGHAGIAVGNKIYLAGGYSCSVEILDVTTGISEMQQLSGPVYYFITSGQNAVVKDGKIIFLRHTPQHNLSNHNLFDIYDTVSNSWSIGVLPTPVTGASVISVNNTIYIAGGDINGVSSNKVYKLEF
jgi:N-acetylneuraminic acid mutarotase